MKGMDFFVAYAIDLKKQKRNKPRKMNNNKNKFLALPQ